jgi:hypothetical protein
MKKINFKSVMVITLLVASVMATPTMVAGYEHDDSIDFKQMNIGTPEALASAFGSIGGIFGSLGYGGNIIGRVFEMLLMQTLTNFTNQEVLPGVYQLSAFSEDTYSGTKHYGSGQSEYYLPPGNYDQSQVKDANLGYAYCEVTKEGDADYELTQGAGVTLIIYDQDKSFIEAVERLLTFIKSFMKYDFETETVPNELISEGVAVLAWFLIHINDIFTGEELFAINPITWQSMKIIPGPGFDVTKTWKATGIDNDVGLLGDVVLNSTFDGMLDSWNASAKSRGDSYMEWLLRPTDDASLVETLWTTFTFDLIQLWVKNFEVHINASAIVKLIGGSSGPVDIASIFRGLDIEFYLFTHHLAGAFLYNDTNSDGKLSTQYVSTPITIDGVPVEVPQSSEVTHRIVLGTVDAFEFELPHKTGENKISWGLKMNDVVITPVPVGVDLESYLGATPELLGYIHFGFSFEPKEVAPGVLAAPIKLDQFFSPWNGPTAPGAHNDITNLDLAIIYLSTMLHFHLNVAVIGEDPEDPTTLLDPADDYNNLTHSLRVGNYLGGAFGSHELEFVDIAGPDYLYGAEGTSTTAPATSSIIPLALYNAEVEKHDTFQDESGTQFTTFATDIALNVSFNVLAYAVCFPMFEDGNGIWHDPTFSVYMVFEAQGFWALILLIAGVGLVGVGTILIKRRKDARF